MQVLKNSGYSSQFRKYILDSGIKGYNSILADHLSGQKPIYRNRDWQKTSRRIDKKNKNKNWLGLFKSCIFVPPTPGSELQKKMQKNRKGNEAWWPRKMAHKNYRDSRKNT